MKRLVLASFGVLAFSGISHADFVKGSQSVALYGGFGSSSSEYDYHPGDKDSVSGAGAAFGGQYLYYVKGSPAIAIGADFLAAPNGTRHSDDPLHGFNTDARLKSQVGLITARLAYPKDQIRPYIFTGIGAYTGSQQLSAQPVAGNQWADGGTDRRIMLDDHRTGAAVGFGIGLDLFPTESFFIGTELRGTWLAGLRAKETQALRDAGFHADNEDGTVQSYVLMHLGWKFK